MEKVRKIIFGLVIILILIYAGYSLYRFVLFESKEKFKVCGKIIEVSTSGQAGVSIDFEYYVDGVRYENYDGKSGSFGSFPHKKGDPVYIEYVLDDPGFSEIESFKCE